MTSPVRGIPVKLPSCGIFIGSGIYPMSRDYLLCVMHGHQAWTPQTSHPVEMLEKILQDNQGNLAQVWGVSRGYAPATCAEWFLALDEIGVHVPEPDFVRGTDIYAKRAPELARHRDRHGAGLLRFMREARARGIYTTFIYTSSEQAWIDRFGEIGEHYLGYDFGERYSFALDSAMLKGKRLDQVTLEDLAADLLARVRAHVDERHRTGWGNVMATSSNFFIDYEVEAGTDIPVVEDFAFSHLNQASALSRGLYRQYNLPMWGSHLAHEHYSWLPWQSPYKFPLLMAAFQQKYMGGSKMIINESGNWFVEATLCEDSPKHFFPRVPLKVHEATWAGNPDEQIPKFVPFIEEARQYYPTIDYTSPYCRHYRQVISDFYDFVKANGTPAGQPESTLAVVKGRLDLCCHRFMPNYAIAGALKKGEQDQRWFEGAPERGWELIRRIFFPLHPVLGPYPNLFLSGTPHGMVDIVSFAQETIDARQLLRNYRALIFSGWNSATPHQYRTLVDYVTAGGRLLLAIPHLSTNVTRNYSDYGVEELVNGGDFSELCGVRVKARGPRFYWATAPDNSDALGFRYPHRFGIVAVPRGEIEITDPAAETLLVDDEQAYPLLLRRRLGKGEVLFLNSWAYPGAWEQDDGPGGRVVGTGLMGYVCRYLARHARGRVWISDDGVEPGPACERIAFSYFPENGEICIQNVDFDQTHRLVLHEGARQTPLELAGGEFRLLRPGRDAVVMTRQETP